MTLFAPKSHASAPQNGHAKRGGEQGAGGDPVGRVVVSLIFFNGFGV